MGPRREPIGVGGWKIGRVLGIDVYLDWSVAIIFALVVTGLGGGVLFRWHPDWSPLLRWGVAVEAAFAFFLSILVHELSHAVVARARGLEVPRITLFVFGGVAQLKGEPSSPTTELLIAAIGPLTSIVIGLGAGLLGMMLMLVGSSVPTDPEALLESAGPVATVLLWLGPINIMLGLFNLVPGFPLDGGRVLRAGLWWATGDVDKATRWASFGGRAFGWTLIGTGILMVFGVRMPLFGVGLWPGLWLAMIGWFLHNAALSTYAAHRMRRRLANVKVRDVMRTGLDTVRPDMSIAELVSDHIMSTDQTSFPVLEGADLVGVVTARDVRRVPSDRWGETAVFDVITPAANVPQVPIDAAASVAVEELAQTGLDQLPVIDHGRLYGFVRQQDIVKWLTLQPDGA